MIEMYSLLTMNNMNSKLRKLLVAMIAWTAMFAPAQAQLYLEENFNYNTGDLYNQGGWMVYNYTFYVNSPIQVIDKQLTYPGYADEPKGKVIELTNTTESSQSLDKIFKDDEFKTGTLYYAFLVNIKGINTEATQASDFIALVQQRGTTFTDGNNGFTFGRVFAKESSAGHFKLGICRGSGTESAVAFAPDEYEYGKTYLVVVKYEIVGENTGFSDADDNVSLFVNPQTGTDEPAPTAVHTNTTTKDFRIGATTGGLKGIALMQNHSGYKNAVNAEIGNIRIAGTWNEVLGQTGGGPVVEIPTLTTDYVSPGNYMTFSKSGLTLVGREYSTTIHLSGTNLKGDVTLEGPADSDFTITPGTTLTKDQVEAGVDIVVTFKPTKYAQTNATLTVSSQDAKALSIPLSTISCVAKEVNNLSEIVNIDNTTGENGPNNLYLVKNAVTVSHKADMGYGIYYYMQDATGGAYVEPGDGFNKMFPNAAFTFERGDEVSDLVVLANNKLNMLYLSAWNGMNDGEYTLVSQKKEVEPRVLTAKDMKAGGAALTNMLVRIEGVTFGHRNGTQLTPITEGETFTDDINNRAAFQDASGAIIDVRILKGSDLIGTPIPAYGNITGISTSSTGMMLLPRDKADVGAVTPPVAVKELLDNWSFESWQTSFLGDSPEGWDTTLGECIQEKTDKIDGSVALRLKAGNKDVSGKLGQEVKPLAEDAFVAGEQYEMTINYKVVTPAADGKTVVLNSTWMKGEEVLDADAALINNGESLEAAGNWTEKKVIVTVPADADRFYFSLKVGKGAEVLFDKFGFKPYDNGEASLLISPQSATFSSTLNKAVTREIIVKANHIEKDINLQVTGTNRAMFSVEPASIPAGQKATIVKVTYLPTEASANHKATLLLDPQTEGVSGMVSLTGAAYDPENPPTITPEMTEMQFDAAVGKSQTKTLKVASKNILDYFVTAKVVNTNLGLFTLSTGSIAKNQDAAELNITFTPKEAGTFNQTVELSATFATTMRVKLTGVATGSTEPEKEGDDFPLITENPLKLMIETFDTNEKNKPVSLNQWKNVSVKGYRAWWGYDLDGEKVSKATAYDSKTTEDYPMEMWLVTPPLDFKNAESKLFTFRMMGTHLFDGMDAKLEVCYMDMNGSELYTEAINIPNIPMIANDNEDWREVHLDFTGQNLADVFFIGFHFTGTGGTANSAVYYVDDVTWGRTDIPMLNFSTASITEVAEVGKTFTSKAINITAANTTEPVTLKLVGPNAGKFSLSTTTLPAAGGEFTVSFKSDVEGVHEAGVKISSRGAADKYLSISINNKKAVDGINEITCEIPADGVVYDLGGRAVYAKDGKLTRGIYIVPMENGKSRTIVVE